MRLSSHSIPIGRTWGKNGINDQLRLRSFDKLRVTLRAVVRTLRKPQLGDDLLLKRLQVLHVVEG